MAKLHLLRSAIAASGAFLAAGAKSRSMMYGMQDPSVTTEQGFIDDTTAYCYKTLYPYYGGKLDRTYTEGILAETIDRPNTLHWCLAEDNNMTLTSPLKCSLKKPESNATGACPSDGWTTENCVRGFDLMQWPETASCSTPRIMWIHGGSWTGDSPWDDSYNVHTSKIAASADAVVFSVDYPLIGGWNITASSDGDPKNFTGTNYVGDASNVIKYVRDAWRWLASNGPDGTGKVGECSGETPPMFIAGDSSGGGSAMQLMMDLLAKDRSGDLDGLPFPSGGFFESPWLNLRSNSPTYYSNNFAAYPSFSAAVNDSTKGGVFGDIAFYYFPGMDQVWDVAGWVGNKTVGSPFIAVQENAKNAAQYCGCLNVSMDVYSEPLPETCVGGTCGELDSMEEQLKNPLFSPFWASRDMLHGMPPLYFATSGTELLAADSSVFAQRLATLGSHVRAELFDGMWHTFPQWSEGCGGNNTLWQGKKAIEHYGQFVKQVADAAARCPEKLRASPDANVPPPESNAVQTVHRVSGGNHNEPWVDIPALDLGICDGPAPRVAPALLGAGGARSSPRHLRAHRPREAAAALAAGDHDAASMLQVPLHDEGGAEEGGGREEDGVELEL